MTGAKTLVNNRGDMHRRELALASLTMINFNNLHVTYSPSYTCGAQHENVENFCLYYHRLNVIGCHFIGDIQDVIPIHIDHILFGNLNYDV